MLPLEVVESDTVGSSKRHLDLNRRYMEEVKLK